MPSIYDLIGMQDPLEGVFPGRPRRQPMFPAPPPEVEDSLLSQLAGGGLSALGYVGSTLDKPGAAVRGLLAGDVGQLANLIPFSDTLGITNEADRVSGRDLLEQYGMLGANTPGLDWGDAAGFGAEVLLDPLTYLSFGGSALTKAGRAADAAGTLASAVRGPMGELITGARQAGIEAGERGLFGIGLPFMQSQAIGGTGPWAQKAAGALDWAGDFARYGNPVGLKYGQLFDAPSMGQPTRAGQLASQDIYALERAGEAEALKQVADVAYSMHDKGGLTGSPDDIADMGRFIVDEVALPDHLQTLEPELLAMRASGPTLQAAELAKGVPVPSLHDDYAKHYFFRGKAELPDQSLSDYNAAIFDASDPHAVGRKDVYKNIPGERDTINQMTTDPFISGAEAATATNQLNRAKYIRGKYLGLNDQDLIDANTTLKAMRGELAKATDPAQAKLLESQIKKQAGETALLARQFKKSFNLADAIGALDEQHVKNKVGLFPNHPLYDYMKRMVSGHKAMGRATGVTQFLGKNARMAPQPGDVPLLDVARKAGLGAQTGVMLTDAGAELARAKQFVKEALGTDLEDDALEQLAELEAKDVATEADAASQGFITELQKVMGNTGDPRYAYVPKEAEEIVTKAMRASASADAAEPVIALVDKFTAAFKVGQLAWPARVVRDMYSAAVANWFDGGLSWRSMKGAWDMATKGTAAVFEGTGNIKDLAARGIVGDEQATRELMKEMFAQKLIGPYGGAWNDINSARVAGTQIAGELPGGIPQTFDSTIKQPWREPGSRNPLNVRGLGMPGRIHKTTEFGYAKMFENLSHLSDTIGRAGPYIEYRIQGFSPAQAAAKVKLAQVDYSNLTAFEKKYMKRAMPFYTFTRRMIPKVVKDLTEKPGGRLAQTIRAENMSRDDQFLPPYLAPGLAIRMPESLGPGNGDTRYLTSIDLPHESVFGLVRPSNTLLGSIENTGLGLMGQFNPLAKVPMELATGKQFYSGRDLSDLDSRIGRMIDPENPPGVPILLDELLMNSPLSRAISTGGTFVDDRKGWGGFATNALSGVKISDVDVLRSRDRVAKDAIEELLEGNPAVRQFSNFYIDPAAAGTLSDEDALLMGAYGAIRERAKQNAGAGRL